MEEQQKKLTCAPTFKFVQTPLSGANTYIVVDVCGNYVIMGDFSVLSHNLTKISMYKALSESYLQFLYV